MLVNSLQCLYRNPANDSALCILCFVMTCDPVYYRKELTADARELKNYLYCLPCHDKMGVPICGACRRPIEGRVVNALGKQWHVEVIVYLLEYASQTSPRNNVIKVEQ